MLSFFKISEVTHFSQDGYFLKGFNFNLELNTNFWIMSPAEAKDELTKIEWGTK